jgi:serine/threonine protein kinase
MILTPLRIRYTERRSFMDDRSSPHTAGPGQFPRARAIFESALERPASEREQLVRDACQDDAALLAVVQAMLHADAQPHALLDTGAALEAGRWQPGETYAGIFRIVGFIGAGGMGEVYRAHDVTLGRDVALKVLSPSFAAAADWGGDRVARLGREAQVLASLNHPNIAAIHRLEDADGVRALVLELVDGQTLAQRLTAGPLSLQDVISTARQIAAALDVAHEQGIVHRDLKPGNITLRPDGTVKVLDFGLAKVMLSESLPSGLATESPTITSPSLIQRGVLLGTPAYMSPSRPRGARQLAAATSGRSARSSTRC